MRQQIKNGNQGAIVSHNGDAFFTTIFVNLSAPPAITEAEAAMDRDMAEATALIPAALWIFGPEGKQIGILSFHREGWKANRMMNGMPTSQRFKKTLPLAVTHVTA